MPARVGSIEKKEKKLSVTENKQLLKNFIKQFSNGGITNPVKFMQELAKVNKEVMLKTMEENSDVEYLLCYAKLHELKYYPHYVKMKTYTKENRPFFLSDKKLLEELNNGFYVYIERNGGDMVIRDRFDVVIEV